MVRAMHNEHQFSDLFVKFLLFGEYARRPTWWISCSTQVKNVSPGFCF